jgi:Bacterial Ig domain
MKTFRRSLRVGQLLGLSLVSLSLGTEALAQTTTSNSLVPVVTILATDPLASGPANTGTFTVLRAGDTNQALNVYYRIGGTASNGVDYAPISNFALIPAGATSNNITIAPLNNGAAGAIKTVVLQLAPSPLLNPVNYFIGSPDTATVYITPPGVTNLQPVVSLLSPTNGQVFYTPVDIPLIARATDLDGRVTNVEFFAGATDLGPGSPVILDPPGVGGVTGLVYLRTWQNVPTNSYSLTAVATDDGGVSTTSTPANITVLPGPPTNIPPVVRIVSPANGSVFHTPINLPLIAFANDPDGNVASVEFFAGSNSLGFGQRLPLPSPVAAGSGVATPVPIIFPTNLFFLTWSNAPVGVYALTAVATDNAGATTTSGSVNLTILPSLPPPTNHPPIVSIVATDPVAIEGTNSWVWPGETNSPPTWAAWPAAVCRSFTNCGPKTATFTVHRFGDTNGDVTVAYDIGGSASNGVDYVTLPGFVTIPSGQHSALITIVPIDDGPPDITKTVILTLTPSTNTPPDYLLGLPRKAAAIILDSAGPQPVTGMLPGNCFHLVIPGPDAAWFHLDCSTDLLNWTPVCTNQAINGCIDFLDPDAQSNTARFYRAVPLFSPPQE